MRKKNSMYVIEKWATYPHLREPVISYFKDCICGVVYYTENIDDALKFSTKEAAMWCRFDCVTRRAGEHIAYKEIPDLNRRDQKSEISIW